MLSLMLLVSLVPMQAMAETSDVHSITVNVVGSGTASASPATASAGETVAINWEPGDGLELKEITGNGPDGSFQIYPYDDEFTMPDGDVTVTVKFGAIGDGDDEYEGGGGGSSAYVVCVYVFGGVPLDQETASVTPGSSYQFVPYGDYEIDRIEAMDGVTGAPVNVSNSWCVEVPTNGLVAYVHLKEGGSGGNGGTPQPTKYNVTVNSDGNGTASAAPTTAEAGDTVTVTATPSEGYELDAITATWSGGNLEVRNGEFTMPAGDVTVTASFKTTQQDPQDPPASKEYDVTVTSDENGTAIATPTKAKQNEKITVTATPNTGYKMDTITATWSGGNLEVQNGEFTMPAGDVTVTVTFKREQASSNAAHTTNPDDNAFKANIDLSDQAVVDMLVTEEDRASGKDIRVYMEVEKLNTSAVPGGDKTAILNKANGRKIAAYLDIRLLKQIGTATPTQIVNTGDNKVPITMKLTAAEVPSGAGKDSFSIIFHHVEGGTATTEEIPATFDPASKTLTFKASKFSTYSLVYTEKGTLDKVVKSGDISGFEAMPLLLLCCAVALAGVAVYDKKRTR